jgi:hypothetical protein
MAAPTNISGSYPGSPVAVVETEPGKFEVRPLSDVQSFFYPHVLRVNGGPVAHEAAYQHNPHFIVHWRDSVPPEGLEAAAKASLDGVLGQLGTAQITLDQVQRRFSASYGSTYFVGQAIYPVKKKADSYPPPQPTLFLNVGALRELLEKRK